MIRRWNESHPSSEHSTKEVEHRFTELEAFTRESRRDREDLHEIVESHTEKLLLHERAIIVLTMAFSALLQEQFPKIAAFLKGSLH